MLAKLGGRKTMMAMIALAAGIAIDLATERGLSQNLMSLMMFIIGAYSTANVITKKVATTDKPSNSAEVDAITSEVLNLRQGQQQVEQYLSGMLSQIEEVQKQVDNSNKRVAALISNKGE